MADNQERKITNFSIRSLTVENINKVFRRIANTYNRREDEINDNFQNFGRYIEESNNSEYSFSATEPNLKVSTDSQGGNQDYSEAVLSLVINKDDNLMRVANESTRSGDNKSESRYSIMSTSVDSGITATFDEDSNQRFRITITALTIDSGQIEVTVRPNGTTKDYKYIFRVFKDKAKATYAIERANGTVIKNNDGFVTLQAKLRDGILDQDITSGDIKLQTSLGVDITVANGFGSGSDGYFGRIEGEDVDQKLIVYLIDTVSGTIHDEVTIADIHDLGYNVSISPQSLPIPTDSDGNNEDFSGAICTIKIFDSLDTQLTYDDSSPYDNGSFRIENVSSADATLSLTTYSNYATISVTAISADQAEISFDLIYADSTGEYTIPYVIRANKVKTGTPGVDAPVSTGVQLPYYRRTGVAPANDGEWAMLDGANYDPSTFGDVDSIKIWYKDKNSNRYSWFFTKLDNEVSTDNPLYFSARRNDGYKATYVCTSVTYASNIITLTVTYLSGGTSTQSSSDVETLIPGYISPEFASTNVQLQFSHLFGDYNWSDSDVQFGLYDSDSDLSEGWAETIPYPVRDTYADEDLSNAYVTVRFKDEFATVYTYQGSVDTAPGIGEYAIRNLKVKKGTGSISDVSNQARISLTAVDGVEAKGFYATATFDLSVYWNGQEKHMGTFTVNFVPDWKITPNGILTLDPSVSNTAIFAFGNALVPFDEAEATFIKGCFQYNNGLKITEDCDNMTIIYECDFQSTNDPDTESGDEYDVKFLRIRNGSTTVIYTEEEVTGSYAGTISDSGHSFEAGDLILVRFDKQDADASNLDWGGDSSGNNVLTIEPD